MRLIRPVLGMVLLAIGTPALLAGGCLWAALRHRDAGGAYSADLQRLSTPGYAIVVPDVDRLLRDDASFARFGGTELRITAVTGAGPAFVGLAPAADVAEYLRGVPYTEVSGVQVGTGQLPVTAHRVAGAEALPSLPGHQSFWTRTGGGALRWTPGDVTGAYSLVIMNAVGERDFRLDGTVEARPGWLDPAAWGLLTGGAILLMCGVIILSRPGRRRDVVYVVEPSQVPELMLAIGAPMPMRSLEAPAVPGASDLDHVLIPGPGGLFGFGGGRKRAGQGGAHRPRTLADSEPKRPPALPQFAWPPNNPGGEEGDSLPFYPISSGTSFAAEPSSGRAAASGTTMTATGILPNSLTPVVPGALPIPSPASPITPTSSAAQVDPASLDPSASPAASVGAAFSAAPVTSATGAGPIAPAAPDAPVAPQLERAGDVSDVHAPVGAQTPAPGSPLGLLAEMPAPAAQPAARPGRRRPPTPTDLPEFHATAVGAWVAQTAPERARQTEAQAAAALAEAARTRVGKVTPADQLIRTSKPAVAPAAAESSAAAPATVPASDAASTVAAPGQVTADGEVAAAAHVPADGEVSADGRATPEGEGSAEVSGAGAEERPDRKAEPSDPADGDATERPGADSKGPNGADSDRSSGADSDRPSGVDSDRPNPKKDGVRRRNVWPAPVPRRVALLTGPNATDWSATGMTRMGGARPSPKHVQPDPASTPDTNQTPTGGLPADQGKTPATSAAQGAARVAAATGTPKALAAQLEAETQPDPSKPAPDPTQHPRQRTGTPAEPLTSDAPTQPLTADEAADAPTVPLVKGVTADVPTQPLTRGAAAEARTESLVSDAVEADASEGATAAPAEAVSETATEPNDEQKTAEPETEKREDAKPPIVPFPTRHPSPSKPVPSARTAEPQRPSIHEAESAGSGSTEAESAEAQVAEAKPAEAETAGITPEPEEPEARTAETAENRPSIHTAEAAPTTSPDTKPGEVAPTASPETMPDEGEPAETSETAEAQAKAPAKPAAKRTDPKRTTEPNRPLTRAQDRISGAASTRQPSSTTTRKVPAAWIKAAENVTARAAAQPESTQPKAATPAAGNAARDDVTKPTVDVAANPVPTTPAQPGPAETAATRKPRPRTARPAPEKPAAKATPKPADLAIATESSDSDAAGQSGAKPSPRTPSYREEAAELLAGTPEPKRRRTTTRRPKETPDGN